MLEQLKILTVTHKRTSLKSIGDYVIKTADNEELEHRLHALKEQFALEGLFYLPTCNRVMYFLTVDRKLTRPFAQKFFSAVNPDLSEQQLKAIHKTAYLLEGEAALEHFFDVAASIDSLVVGERQILRQMREAFDQCQAWKLIDDTLRLAMRYAVVAAKEVYSRTRIGDKPVSIVSLAVQRMLKAGVPKDARILLVGAGQTNALVAKFLAKHHYENVVVFNRTLHKAEALAETLNGSARPLSGLPDYQGGFDCLIVCTGATRAVITPELFQRLRAGETERKVIIDLAIPHNVSPEVADSEAVHYIEIEGLRNLAKENLAFREEEVMRAKKLLAYHLAEFPMHLRQRQLEKAMRQVPEEIKAVKSRAMEVVFRNELETLDEQSRDLLERMMSYMEKKCIGIPMKAARSAVI